MIDELNKSLDVALYRCEVCESCFGTFLSLDHSNNKGKWFCPHCHSDKVVLIHPKYRHKYQTHSEVTAEVVEKPKEPIYRMIRI